MSIIFKRNKALPLFITVFFLLVACDSGLSGYDFTLDPRTSEASPSPNATPVFKSNPGKTQEVPDELTTEQQEAFVSEMMDLIIESKWYLKKISASKTALPDRRENLLREVDSRMTALNQRKSDCVNKKWLTDPACNNKFSEDIIPALVDVNRTWLSYLRNNFPLSLYEITCVRDDIKALYAKNDYSGVLTQYTIIEKKIGKYYFDCANRLDKDFNLTLRDIERMQEKAKARLGGQRGGSGRDGFGSRKNLHAYLVKIVPKIGTKYEAVIKDPMVIRHLEQNKPLDLKTLKPDSTITLYYMRGMNGTTGVKVKDIQFLTALLPLSKSELEEVKGTIGKRIENLNIKEVARLEELKKKHAEQAAREEAEAKKIKEEEARKQAQVERFGLLDKFPPEEGWSEMKKSEIERRKVVLNVYPSEKEQAFLDSFKDWIKQYNEWKALRK